MLMLNRRKRETLLLETSEGLIEIRIRDENGDRIRVGISTPPPINVLRKLPPQKQPV